MLIFNIINYFYGYYKLSTDNCNSEKIINLLMTYNIRYWQLKKSSDGDLTFKILRKDFKILSTLVYKLDYKIYTLYEKGFPNLLSRYKRRLGIPVGIMIFFAILWSSTFFIWEVNVSGNKKVRNEEIISQLNDLGFGIGTFISGIDYNKLCNEYLLNSQTITWLTVNIRGTVANIEVKERVLPVEIFDAKKPTNLIAKSDGQIDHLVVLTGDPVVNIGDSVKKGDLLVSGLIDSKRIGYRKEHSSGSVYARVTKNLRVNIPLNTTKKVFTGNSIKKKILNIFGKKINLFINSGIHIEKYDKIVDNDKLIFFDVVEVPVNITTEIYNEYSYESKRLTEEEAVKIANIELTKLMTKELYKTDVLEKKITAEFINDAYVINCEVYCLEDIAVESEILIQNND